MAADRDDPCEPVLLTAAQVGKMLGMSERSVLREADRNPDFPQPVRIGVRQRADGKMHARFTRWPRSVVDEFVARCASEARSA